MPKLDPELSAATLQLHQSALAAHPTYYRYQRLSNIYALLTGILVTQVVVGILSGYPTTVFICLMTALSIVAGLWIIASRRMSRARKETAKQVEDAILKQLLPPQA